MSSEYTKIPATQSAPYTGTRNLLDFHIPPNVYDFSKSYVELSSFVEVVDPDATAGANTAVFNMRANLNNARTGGQNTYLENNALVKNVYFRTASKGVVENRRRNDRFRANMNYFTKTSNMLRSEGAFNSLMNISGSDDFSTGNFVEFHGSGDKASTNRTRKLQIPLKDLMSLGNVSSMNLDRLGMSQMHLELNVGNVVLAQEQSSTDPKFVADAKNRNAFLDIPQNTADPTILVSKGIYTDLDQVPFYVSQKLTITSVGTGGIADINQVHRITKIERATSSLYGNDVEDRIEITLDRALPSTGAGETHGTLQCLPLDAGASSITFDDANLVLNIPDRPLLDNDALQFTTYTLEQDNANGSTSFIKTYELEPECKNVFICFGNNIVSDSAGITDYRLSIDNNDLTDRNVVMGSREHKSLIQKFFDNSGRPLRRIKETVFNNTSITDPAHEAGVFEVIAFPVPITEGEKLLQVEINSGGLNALSIFKEVERAI
jgi:hypothetical protein